MTDPIKAEPVACKVQAPDSHYFELRHFPMGGLLIENGWTETPLYTHAQLVEERRRAWNDAIEAAATVVASQISADTNMRDYITTYFATRALTKENTND